jgi:5-formyltetrahydrofolate cyclo-ligase
LSTCGEEIAAHGLVAWRGVPCVAAYVGVGTEPPTRALIDGLAAAGTRVLLPVIDATHLRWATYEGWESLRPGPLGIPQPAQTGDQGIAAADVVIAPALAVDGSGHRLGRGGGYYDRALAAVDAAVVVAVVFDDEILDAVPVKPHDRPVGAVLTPGGGLRRLA